MMGLIQSPTARPNEHALQQGIGADEVLADGLRPSPLNSVLYGHNQHQRMNDRTPGEWDANLAQIVLKRRVALSGWVVLGLLLANGVANAWPSQLGLLAAFFVLLLPMSVLAQRLRFTECSRCKKPLFFPVGWTNMDIFTVNRCGRCGVAYSSGPLLRGSDDR